MKRYIVSCGVISQLLVACSNLEEANHAATTSLNNFKNDTGGAWRDLFSYNAKPRTPQPASTRYCYQFASDIVCYDSPQPQLTARLVGVQGGEGARMIVYQQSDVSYGTAAPAIIAPESVSSPMPTGAPFGQPTAPVGGNIIQSKDLPAPTAAPVPAAKN